LGMSALPPKADMLSTDIDVCFVPIADIAADPQQANALVGRFQLSAGLALGPR